MTIQSISADFDTGAIMQIPRANLLDFYESCSVTYRVLPNNTIFVQVDFDDNSHICTLVELHNFLFPDDVTPLLEEVIDSPAECTFAYEDIDYLEDDINLLKSMFDAVEDD